MPHGIIMAFNVLIKSLSKVHNSSRQCSGISEHRMDENEASTGWNCSYWQTCQQLTAETQGFHVHASIISKAFTYMPPLLARLSRTCLYY